MTPEEHWTEHAPRPRRPRLGPLLHRVAAELPHISEAKGMRMEGGTRLAFLSFYGVQNARTLVVHAAEPTSKSVSLLALDEAFLRAAVAAAGWTRGPVQHVQVEAAGPLARWLGQLNLSCVQPRKPTRAAQLGPTTRRISVTVEDSPEELERVISMTTSDTDGGDEPPWVGGAAGGRSRTISVNISGSPDRRRVTVDESYAPVRPRSAWCRWCRCAQCLA